MGTAIKLPRPYGKVSPRAYERETTDNGISDAEYYG
jgi:hypothetical protein